VIVYNDALTFLGKTCKN